MIETVQITGRTPKAWYLKLNPIWWLYNSDEPLPPDWYLPTQSAWLRIPCWYLRNPFVNFADYVIGVCDRNYAVTGTAPVEVPLFSDIGLTGWKWSVCRWWLPLPFMSYSGKRILGYAGWKHTGDFGLKLNIRNSSVQVV